MAKFRSSPAEDITQIPSCSNHASNLPLAQAEISGSSIQKWRELEKQRFLTPRGEVLAVGESVTTNLSDDEQPYRRPPANRADTGSLCPRLGIRFFQQLSFEPRNVCAGI